MLEADPELLSQLNLEGDDAELLGSFKVEEFLKTKPSRTHEENFLDLVAG